MTCLRTLIAASIIALVGGQSLFTSPPTVAPNDGANSTTPSSAAPTTVSTDAPTAATTSAATTEYPTTILATYSDYPSNFDTPETSVPTVAAVILDDDDDDDESNNDNANDEDDNQVSPPVSGGCNGMCDDSYSSLDKIQAAINMLDGGTSSSSSGSGTVCLCPNLFSPDAGNCPLLLQGTKPGILITDQRNVILECVSPLGAKCIFACPNTIVQVASGGNFTLIGGNNTVLTGGELYSRVHVDEGGSAVIVGVEFQNTAVGNAHRRRRHLAEDITASGMGGGISNMGSVEVHTSSFSNCSAANFGGAIYTQGDAKIMSCSFVNNMADTGGAIYASGNFVLERNSFSGNVASESGANLAGDAQLSVCGNQGLAGSVACPGDSSSAATTIQAATMASIMSFFWATVLAL